MLKNDELSGPGLGLLSHDKVIETPKSLFVFLSLSHACRHWFVGFGHARLSIES